LQTNAKIGIIGGSGFYTLLKEPKLVESENRYGKPSSPLAMGTRYLPTRSPTGRT
jgi:purine nucleoside phosphorylase